MLRVASPKDLIAGTMFAALAIAGLWLSSDYPTGTAFRMGPGYVPRLLLVVLLGLGLAVATRSLVVEDGSMGAWAWRPLVVIPGAMLLFGLALERLGLVVATVAVVFTSSLALRSFRPAATLGIAAALALFAVGVFVGALRLNIPIWPP